MEKNRCGIGIVGAGTVGGGVAQLLLERPDLLAGRAGVEVELRGVAELDRQKALDAGVPEALWVEEYKALLARDDIDIIVELVGGTGIAETMVRESLEGGKAVVTANKALLAEKGLPLFALAREKKLPLAFEAAVAGGIPIILAIREGLIANRITSLFGILNGTCNYILTEMIEKGIAYADCLKSAQELGYAEADPTFDVEGFDTGHKLALLSALAMGTWVEFKEIAIEGISTINLMDIDFAQQLGYTVKLLAVARPDEKRLFLSVHPALLKDDHPLASVHGSMNAIALNGDAVMESMFYGRGAGRMPTASAVVADIMQIARGLAGGPSVVWSPPKDADYELAPMEDYQTRYYLRFDVLDKPGVLGRMTTILGNHGVSIASVVQHEEPEGYEQDAAVPVVLVSHTAREGNVRSALAEIGQTDFLSREPIFIRIEE